jgi:hypothetical protein
MTPTGRYPVRRSAASATANFSEAISTGHRTIPLPYRLEL